MSIYNLNLDRLLNASFAFDALPVDEANAVSDYLEGIAVDLNTFNVDDFIVNGVWVLDEDSEELTGENAQFTEDDIIFKKNGKVLVIC